jgi:IS5 family transposase
VLQKAKDGFFQRLLSREAAPDATTLLKLRRLLEKRQLTKAIFQVLNGHLEDKRLLLRQGAIVDASIIAAPPSTKNRDKARAVKPQWCSAFSEKRVNRSSRFATF